MKKLNLRRFMKEDVSKRKSGLSVQQRSLLRSRREAAVSRANKAAYTGELEDLIHNLVQTNLKLVDSLQTTQAARQLHRSA